MRKKLLYILALVVALVLTGTASAGSVSGTVKFEGNAPKLRPLKMDADPGCAKKHASGAAANEMLVLGEGNALANILVRVKSGLAKKDYSAPSQAAVIDQDGCRYTPHVLGVMVGQELIVKNSDGLLHNVHALPKVNGEFNRAMPATVTEFTHKFDKVEDPFLIKCDVHPWMGAYVAVMDHPFFAVTDKSGKFKIDGLPAGTYEIEAWHEKLPAKTASVTVGADDSKSVDFALSVPSR